MLSKVNRLNTNTQIFKYTNEIFDLYASSVGELNVSSIEESFIRDLVKKCINILSGKEMFEIIKELKNRNLLLDDILANSSVHRVVKSSDLLVSDTIKCEVEELSCNSLTKHLRDNGEIISSYETSCFTIPSLRSKIDIGNSITNITYKNNGMGITPNVVVSKKPDINFNINNVIILHKKEFVGSNHNEYVNVVIVPRLESIQDKSSKTYMM